jgi:5-formyltetrahydrofolate cyclo-ligase
MSLDRFQSAGVDIMREVGRILPPRRHMVVGCYWPMRREADCLPYAREVLVAGGRIALPVVVAHGKPLEFRLWTEKTRMEAGVWNIPQPAEGSSVSPTALVIPVLGFDEAGFRLGYGAGYYDITLAALSPRPFTVGVGFESARLGSIYPQPHDIPLDVVVTEACKRVFRQG